MVKARNYMFSKYDKADKVLASVPTIKDFVKKNYGFGPYFYKFMLSRFEKLTSTDCSKSRNYKNILVKSVRTFLTRKYDFKNIFTKNTYYLLKVDCYRAWRQLRGLPSRGQRTWSNANTPFYRNSTLRNFLYNKSKLEYSGVQPKIATIGLLAEYCNNTWRFQWYKEWTHFRVKRSKFKNKFGGYKIDLYTMSKFNVKVDKSLRISRRKRKKQQSRKKTTEDQNLILSGFDRGFTKMLLAKSKSARRSNQMQVILGKPVIKQKKTLKRKKKNLAAKKKIKKSVWD